MYNFYQSALWNQINKDVYNKSVTEVRRGDHTYQVLIKQKHIGPLHAQRYQIQGIEFGSLLSQPEAFRQQLQSVKKQLCSSRRDIFIQFGSVDVISSFDTKQIKFGDFCESMRHLRQETVSQLIQQTGLVHSFTENMPTATIITTITKSDTELAEGMGQGCRQQIKKAQTKHLTFHIAQYQEREEFYQIRQGVGSGKGFHIIPKAQYDALRDFLLTDTGSLFHRGGNLFVTKLDGTIISGSIVLYDLDTMIYLYGGTDRSAGNIGSHQYLMAEIMKRGRDNGFSRFDLMGGAPTGYDDHPLASVSKFKEALGGTKIEYIGNMDLITNPLLYRLFKRRKGSH